MSNDWDLYAIVKSCSSTAPDGRRKALEDKFFAPGNFFESDDDDFVFDVPQSPPPLPASVDPKNDSLADPFDELSCVYKPFYPNAELTAAGTGAGAGAGAGATAAVAAPSPVAASPGFDATAIRINDATQQEATKHPQQNQNHGVGSRGPKERKRKKPRMVIKVDAEGLPSHDHWTWRKYGQKQITGSSAPSSFHQWSNRSYYRCTSFKGCSARKHVDKKENEPDVYVVTYFGEHNHRRGGRRMGRSRRKMPASPISGDIPAPDNNPKCEPFDMDDIDDEDILMAMQAFISEGPASTSGKPQFPPKDSV